jgi:hypothetical protein
MGSSDVEVMIRHRKATARGLSIPRAALSSKSSRQRKEQNLMPHSQHSTLQTRDAGEAVDALTELYNDETARLARGVL